MFSFSNSVLLQDLATLKSSLSLFPLPVYVVNDQFQLTFVNAAFADIFPQINFSDIIYSRGFLFDVMLDDERVRFMQAFEVMLSKKNWVGELKYTVSSEEERFFETHWVLVTDGTTPCAIVFHTDITEKKKLQEQVLRSQRMESLGLVMSGVTHDLNNILSTVMVGSRLLLGKVSDDQSKLAIELMERGAKRGGGLIRHLLSFVRGMDQEYETFSLQPLITELREIVLQVTDSEIEFKLDIPDFIWNVHANVVQIHQVIMNLCLNAKDAMENKGGVLLVTACNQDVTLQDSEYLEDLSPGKYVCIQVCDTGPGIPKEVAEKIFEPFFTTKSTKGTGLGLSTVMTIVRNHKGVIKVRSVLGKGTQFMVFLPAVEK